VSTGSQSSGPAGGPPAGPVDWVAIVERVREGDPVALAKLTALVTSLLYRQGAYRVRESWEDICQDVLAALVRSVENESLQEPRAFVSYAYTLTRNYFLDFVQRRQRITSGGRRDEFSIREPVERAADRPAQRMHPDMMLDLERALETLPVRGRRVIEEIYLRGRTYQEAADRLDLPLGTIKRLQTAGLRQLRQVLHLNEEDRRSPAKPLASRKGPAEPNA